MNFGQRVIALRKAAHIKSAAELARRVGISQPSMWAIETGRADLDDIKIGTFMRLAKALQTNPTYLYTGRGLSIPTLDPAVITLITRIALMSDSERRALAHLFEPEPSKTRR